jgi:hypothetical protein
MIDAPLAYAELLELEGTLWIFTAPVGLANYDFSFAPFRNRAPREDLAEVTAIARVGTISNYQAVYTALREDGIRLLHTPHEHARASELPAWYPLLADLTPRSIWMKERPDPKTIAAAFTWPIFLKGTRQTCHHRRSLSVIDGPEQLERALDAYARDPALRLQGHVCREYVRLRLVEEPAWDCLPSAFEFRTFWWKGELVGWGRYWCEGKPYQATEQEADAGLAVARESARRLQVPFLVVDIAQTVEGRWLVIECNDGQESCYGGVSPVELWQNILRLETQVDVRKGPPCGL